MSKKYFKILIIIILSCILITVFYQIGVKPLSGVQIGPNALSEKNVKVSLEVLNKKYETNIEENSTVFKVMKKIEEKNTEDNLFNFKYTEYASLGSFITEINGIKGTSGKYWIYYVNGKEASVGVSKYILKSGDIISWKQE